LAGSQGFLTVSSVTKDFGVCKFVKALTYSKPILGKSKFFGNQKSWEIRNLGKSEILGNQKSWEYRNLGNTEILGIQKSWETRFL
jgi:hypothetical protein